MDYVHFSRIKKSQLAFAKYAGARGIRTTETDESFLDLSYVTGV